MRGSACVCLARGSIVVRILKIDLPGSFQSGNPDISLHSSELRDALFKELFAMQGEMASAVRARVASYFPGDYEIFTRIHLDPETAGMRVTTWVADPNIRWPAGLLARRAWNLSIPVLSHVVHDVISEHIDHVELVVDDSKARVMAFAPARFWKDPVVLTVGVFLLTTLYWLVAVPVLAPIVRGWFGF